MARAARLHIKNVFYHVMVRGNRGQDTYYPDKDRLKFYSLLEECVSKFKFHIHAFCLMSNHVHLVIQISAVSISKSMRMYAFDILMRGIRKLEDSDDERECLRALRDGLIKSVSQA